MSTQMQHATLKRAPHTGLALLLICATCWGSGVAITKDLLQYLPPVTTLTIQLLVSSLVLWGVNLVSGSFRQLRPHHLKHGLPGLLEPGAVFVLALVGLSYTSATNAALIGAVEPLILIGLSWLLLREAIQRNVLRLIAIAMLGTLIVGLSDAGGGANSLHGDLLVVGATVCAALYTLASRQSSTQVPPLLLAALQQTCALIGVALLLPFQAALAPMPDVQVPITAYLLAIFTGAFEFALPYLLYLYAIRHVSTAQAALFPMIVPIFGVASAVVLLGEPVSLGQLAGAVLVIGASGAIHFSDAGVVPLAENEAYDEALDYAEVG